MHSVPEYLRQVLWCTSFNLVSSRDAYRTSESEFDLPTSFFFDIDAIEYLAGAIDTMADVIPAKRLQMPTGHYRQAVAARKMAVTEDAPTGRKVDGDTHFAFLVPERAFEDLAVLKELVNSGVLSARLGLCLILVDFTNPVFSPDRAALLGCAPASVAAGSDGRALDEAFIDAIREKAAATGGDPESQLLMLWENTDLLEHVRTKLSAFHEVLTEKLASPAGVMDLLDLAGSRREAVAGQKRSLAEFQSTFARADQPVEHLAIREDGSTFAKASELGEGEL